MSRLCLLALLSTILVACDDTTTCTSLAEAEAAVISSNAMPLAEPANNDDNNDAAEQAEFREEGPPEMWVITEWKGAVINTATFAMHALACVDVHDPTWTCTFSARQPNLASPQRVIGLGCSAWAPPQLYECLLDGYKKSDAIKYQ